MIPLGGVMFSSLVVVVPAVSEPSPEPLGRNGACRAEARSAKANEADAYLAARSSLMIASSASMTSSRSTLDFANFSCSLKAFVGAL